MTKHKRLKQLVRERMRKTGERYAAARRQIIARAERSQARDPSRWHLPGNVPATAALRVLLAAAGVADPATGKPYSEAMLFGIAGGIGAGVFAFLYENEDFASFYVAGRHAWEDDLGYLSAALERFGLKPELAESGGAKAADKQLRDALASGRPVVAWVDAAGLPHRAMPPQWSGGGYHVVTVYLIDDAAGTVLIGDLADEPVAVPIDVFAAARGRIKKFKHRLLSLPAKAIAKPASPERLIHAGMRACHSGTTGRRMKNFTLDAFRTWGERMHGSSGKESWDHIFPRGHRLWTGLTFAYDFIEHYGTGGGLMRPLFAEFFTEAHAALRDPALKELAERYGELGTLWSELAEAALPDGVPEFEQAKRLLAAKAELTFSGDADAPDAIRNIWSQLSDVQQRVKADFPLSERECDELRAGLKRRILDIHAKESAALAAIGAAAK